MLLRIGGSGANALGGTDVRGAVGSNLGDRAGILRQGGESEEAGKNGG